MTSRTATASSARANGGDLRQDVDAVAVLLNHALKAGDLAGDALQPAAMPSGRHWSCPHDTPMGYRGQRPRVARRGCSANLPPAHVPIPRPAHALPRPLAQRTGMLHPRAGLEVRPLHRIFAPSEAASLTLHAVERRRWGDPPLVRAWSACSAQVAAPPAEASGRARNMASPRGEAALRHWMGPPLPAEALTVSR